ITKRLAFRGNDSSPIEASTFYIILLSLQILQLKLDLLFLVQSDNVLVLKAHNIQDSTYQKLDLQEVTYKGLKQTPFLDQASLHTKRLLRSTLKCKEHHKIFLSQNHLKSLVQRYLLLIYIAFD